MKKVALESDVNEFFRQAQGALEQRDHQRMRKPFGEHSDAAADRAGIGADEVGDLPECVVAGEGEVEEVLVGRGKLVQPVEDLRPRLFWIFILPAAVGSAAKIEDEFQITTGHLTPLSGPFGPVITSV